MRRSSSAESPLPGELCRLPQLTYAGARPTTGGGIANRAMRSRIVANRFRFTATSASWNVTYLVTSYDDAFYQIGAIGKKNAENLHVYDTGGRDVSIVSVPSPRFVQGSTQVLKWEISDLGLLHDIRRRR